MTSEVVLDSKGKPTGEYRFNAHGALKGLELIGKHLGMWDGEGKEEGKKSAPSVVVYLPEGAKPKMTG